ncbi:hypothetical protein ILYODFUR_034145 [Ilyodon furcidens]|uniref:Uncharacterized protein n=1 Tax=Ilyodon furcidens TaxID=33524 RepID=A0ABV0T676_9TELE
MLVNKVQPAASRMVDLHSVTMDTELQRILNIRQNSEVLACFWYCRAMQLAPDGSYLHGSPHFEPEFLNPVGFLRNLSPCDVEHGRLRMFCLFKDCLPSSQNQNQLYWPTP